MTANEKVKEVIKLGLAQLTTEALARIINHTGEMLLDGRIYSESLKVG